MITITAQTRLTEDVAAAPRERALAHVALEDDG
jgi:hypothetical protein